MLLLNALTQQFNIQFNSAVSIGKDFIGVRSFFIVCQGCEDFMGVHGPRYSNGNKYDLRFLVIFWNGLFYKTQHPLPRLFISI